MTGPSLTWVTAATPPPVAALAWGGTAPPTTESSSFKPFIVWMGVFAMGLLEQYAKFTLFSLTLAVAAVVGTKQ